MFISKRCDCSSKENKCIPSNVDLQKLSDNLTLLSVKSRLDLLFLLNDKSHCVCDLGEHTEMSQSLISHHLSDLTKAGFVDSKREGKFIDYFLTPKGDDLVKTLITLTNKNKGGEDNMSQDNQNCDCTDDKKNCCEEDKLDEMSKDDLLARKNSLEESLKEVNEALTNTK